jgi:hypothetical protein
MTNYRSAGACAVKPLRLAAQPVGGREAGVEFNGASQQRLGFAAGVFCSLIPQLAPAQEAVVGFLIVSVLHSNALAVAAAEIERERGDDLGRHVVLHGEDVGHFPIEPLRP